VVNLWSCWLVFSVFLVNFLVDLGLIAADSRLSWRRALNTNLILGALLTSVFLLSAVVSFVWDAFPTRGWISRTTASVGGRTFWDRSLWPRYPKH